MRYLLLSTIAATPLLAADLNIYTYDSFASEWGPGPQLEKLFEAECGCDIEFTTAGDGAALLTRLRLEGKNSPADVVIGIDQNLAQTAWETDLFAAREGVEQALAGANVEWSDDAFSAYDWGYFAFVYKKDKVANPPKNFEELADSDLKIVIEDPRSSTPGLGLAAWIYTVYGDEAKSYWERLADNIVTVTPGWSEAYSLFLEDQADMVLSYTTSPAYHAIAESDDGFAAAGFEEGHAMQIELAGLTQKGAESEVAQKFLDFMVSDEAQKVINTTNWMYPVAGVELPEGFTPIDQFKALETSNVTEDLNAAQSAYENGIK